MSLAHQSYNQLLAIFNAMSAIPMRRPELPAHIDASIKEAVQRGWEDVWIDYPTQIRNIANTRSLVTSEELRGFLVEAANLQMVSPRTVDLKPEQVQAYINSYNHAWTIYRQTIKRMLGGGG